MQLKEEILEIQGDDGLVRRGIITMPVSKKCSNTGVLLLPAGLKYRIGPQRFYVTIARYLAEMGYPVLRIDPVGIGESDGELPASANTEIFRTIEEGYFSDDALLAAETMKKRFSLQKIVAGGICGGAITSQLAAVKRNGLIDGIISINTSVSIAGISATKNMMIGDVQANKNYHAYLKKIFSWHAWLRVLTGESSLRTIFKTLYSIIKRRLRIKNNKTRVEPFPHENPLFIESFKLLNIQGVKHFLLFSGNDNRWSEFQDVILNRYLGGKMRGKNYSIKVIPDANHEFHFREWQQQAIDEINNWILCAFPK